MTRPGIRWSRELIFVRRRAVWIMVGRRRRNDSGKACDAFGVFKATSVAKSVKKLTSDSQSAIKGQAA